MTKSQCFLLDAVSVATKELCLCNQLSSQACCVDATRLLTEPCRGRVEWPGGRAEGGGLLEMQS